MRITSVSGGLVLSTRSVPAGCSEDTSTRPALSRTSSQASSSHLTTSRFERVAAALAGATAGCSWGSSEAEGWVIAIGGSGAGVATAGCAAIGGGWGFGGGGGRGAASLRGG